jgi:inorganic pyrophosphatase
MLIINDLFQKFVETLALDGDPLDVLVLVNEATPWMRYGSKAHWCFHMADDETDERNLCTGI